MSGILTDVPEEAILKAMGMDIAQPKVTFTSQPPVVSTNAMPTKSNKDSSNPSKKSPAKLKRQATREAKRNQKSGQFAAGPRGWVVDSAEERDLSKKDLLPDKRDSPIDSGVVDLEKLKPSGELGEVIVYGTESIKPLTLLYVGGEKPEYDRRGLEEQKVGYLKTEIESSSDKDLKVCFDSGVLRAPTVFTKTAGVVNPFQRLSEYEYPASAVGIKKQFFSDDGVPDYNTKECKVYPLNKSERVAAPLEQTVGMPTAVRKGDDPQFVGMATPDGKIQRVVTYTNVADKSGRTGY